MSEMNSAEKY